MAASEAKDVFKLGKFEVCGKTVETTDASKPPVELYIVAPVTTGTYGVLLFCHGFMLDNTCYKTLLQHITSHGYIVVAPKLSNNFLSSCDEVCEAAKVSIWLSTGLPDVLPKGVCRDINNLALAGHSRGGQAAFALATIGKIDKKCRKDIDPTLLPEFKALIGIDPVAGFCPWLWIPPFIWLPPIQLSPKILTQKTFETFVPVAVIGTGYGNQPKGLISPFAPDGVNQLEFFNKSKPSKCHFVAKDYGHCDMLDDGAARCWSFFAKSSNCCWDPMRKCVGGIVVAFMEAYLGGHEEDLNAIVKNPSLAPITLDQVEYVKK